MSIESGVVTAEKSIVDFQDAGQRLARLALGQRERTISDPIITAVVTTLMTLEETSRPGLEYIQHTAGISRGSAHNALGALEEVGFVSRTMDSSRLIGPTGNRLRGGKARSVFLPTEELQVAINENVEWQNSIRIREIANSEGLSDQEALVQVLDSYTT
jgi:hypothetical protein